MTDCTFCKIVAKEIAAKIVYEDNTTIAFLDRKPVNLGHALVIPKQHAADMFALSPGAWSALMHTVHFLASAIAAAAHADGINIRMNNKAAAGQDVFHAHVHVVPRFTGDGLSHWQGTAQSDIESELTAEKIRAVLRSE
jgi:histidine triad (HIT) family protein